MALAADPIGPRGLNSTASSTPRGRGTCRMVTYNNQAVPARARFWVSPAGRLRELFDKLHDLQDLDEAVRLSRECGVHFVPPS